MRDINRKHPPWLPDCREGGRRPDRFIGRVKRSPTISALTVLTVIAALASPKAICDPALPRQHFRLTRLVTGWLPSWENNHATGEGWRSVNNHLDMLDEVSFFSAEADVDTGELKPNLGAPPEVLNAEVATLHENDVQALLTVTCMKNVHTLLDNPKGVQRFSDGIVALLDRYNLDGVDIDFEDFSDKDPADTERYTNFLEGLATRLHQRPDSFTFPTSVIATILARTQRGKFAFADDQALANSDIDQVRIMAYDENWPGSKTAGADAPLPWVMNVAQYLRSLDAPSWKFILGVPAYGDRWPVKSEADWTTLAKGTSVTFPKALSQMQQYHAARQWSESDQAPYLSYDEAGKRYIAFYEDAASWRAKIDKVVAAGEPPLGGMAEWALGYEDPNAWNLVHKRLMPEYPIYAAIGLCYTRFGGGARFGQPIEPEQNAGLYSPATLNGRKGRAQQFEHAIFYYEWDRPRAYYVEGRILARYIDQGGPKGALGFPISDPVATPNGAVTQQFEHGTIDVWPKTVSTAATPTQRLQAGASIAEIALVAGGYATARLRGRSA